ncbi:MAG TPA: hypothetical protein VMU92_14425 [Acidobacteriaceae bacterium]|nr:hypothetical protein [Acidobacteriaceae bacterium]
MSYVHAILNFMHEIFLGCSHQRKTRPITLQNETYMVCMDCGKQIYYSTETMHTLSAREVRHMRAVNAITVRIMPASANRPSLAPTQARKTDAA